MAIFTDSTSAALQEHYALVMLWSGREPYPVSDSVGYFDTLNLDSGKKLHATCAQIWPGYGEVIRNRKWCISSMAERILARPDAPAQLVITGSGLAPLAMELHIRWPEMSVYDLDYMGMSAKHDKCMSLGCCDPQKLHFVPVDIAECGAVASRLAVAGWDSEAPSLIIAEGTSYYLSPEQMSAFAGIFPASSLMLADYLLHPGHVHFSRRNVPYEIFSVISRHFDLDAISTWTGQSLGECLDACMLEQWSMYDVEMARRGQSLQFPSADMGWIEMAAYILNS